MSEANNLVSVIVSVYNVEARLPRCLESISSQTHRDLEIILIDDGSTDSSGRLCDIFVQKEPRARVIHQENRGLYTVRNQGVEEAKGEYVIFPDGDDYFHKDYIRLLYEAINLNGKAYPIALCDYRSVRSFDEDVLSDSLPVFEEMNQKDLMDRIVRYPSCGSALWGANWNKLYRKSALSWPFQKAYKRCQDYDSNLRLFSQIEGAVYVKKVLYYWVQWPGQSTRTADFIQVRDACRTQIFYDQYLNIPGHLISYRPYLLDNVYRRLIVWLEDAHGTSNYMTVLRAVRKYERKSLFSFLSTSLLSVHQKIRWLFSLHAPLMLRLLGKSIPMELA